MNEYVFIAVLIGVALVIWIAHRSKLKREEEEHKRQTELLRQRREALIEKYGSEKIADDIIAHKIWQGMRSEQLKESWGTPEDIDEKVYKQKTSQIWKYGQTGRNRYSQRVFIENGVVVGWQQQ